MTSQDIAHRIADEVIAAGEDNEQEPDLDAIVASIRGGDR